jgi:hypothetical protein
MAAKRQEILSHIETAEAHIQYIEGLLKPWEGIDIPLQSEASLAFIEAAAKLSKPELGLNHPYEENFANARHQAMVYLTFHQKVRDDFAERLECLTVDGQERERWELAEEIALAGLDDRIKRAHQMKQVRARLQVAETAQQACAATLKSFDAATRGMSRQARQSLRRELSDFQAAWDGYAQIATDELIALGFRGRFTHMYQELQVCLDLRELVDRMNLLTEDMALALAARSETYQAVEEAAAAANLTGADRQRLMMDLQLMEMSPAELLKRLAPGRVLAKTKQDFDDLVQVVQRAQQELAALGTKSRLLVEAMAGDIGLGMQITVEQFFAMIQGQQPARVSVTVGV